MEVAWASAVVSFLSTLVAVGAIVVSVVDGRAARRNTEFSGHRDMWWQRWSWVADRATSDDERRRDAAAVMASALVTRAWTTEDDTWMFHALEGLERPDDDDAPPVDGGGEGAPDDLEDE